jgi:multiple sugar transport system permease protein
MMEATNEKASPEKTGLDIEKEKRTQKALDITKATFAYIFLTICAVLAFLPFYWMIISSLKTEDEYRLTQPTFFPREFKWQNYSYMLTSETNGFGQALFNTVLIGVVSTLFGVVVIILTSYALARIEFKGKGILFSLMLATMMIPGELYTITNYVTVSNFGWSNTYIVMILPFLVSIYYVYLLRNTFKSIPESLYKAAKVDGCGKMAFLVKVMVPLAAPTLISITLLKFIATWNSYIWPQLVNTKDYHLISNWMTSGFTNDGTLYPLTGKGSWTKSESLTTLRMCAACLVSMPLFVLFLFFRKYIMHGVSKSGTKG